MASKQELEQQVNDLNKIIKDLEDKLKVHEAGDVPEDPRVAKLQAEVDNLNRLVQERIERAKETNDQLQRERIAREQAEEALASLKVFLESSRSEKAASAVDSSKATYTAKEIVYHHHRREFDDGKEFIEK